MTKVLAALILVVGLVLLISLSPLFKIRKIDINGQSCISNESQLTKYQITGKYLTTFNSKGLEANLKQDFGCIENVKVKKSWPQTLKLQITTQLPVAKIEGKDLAITKDGKVISTAQNKPTATIFLPQEINVNEGDKITNIQVLFAAEVAGLLQKTDFAAQNIRIVDNANVAVYNSTGAIALFSQKKAASGQVDSLQQILAKAKIDAIKISKVDLTFEKPVITYK